MIRVVHRDANLLAADRVYLDAAPSRRTPSGREPRRSSPVVDISAVGAEQRKGRPGPDALLSRGLFSLRREAVPLLVSNAVFEYGVFVVEQSAIAAWRRSHCERTARRPSTRSNHLDRKLLAGGGRENNIASTRTGSGKELKDCLPCENPEKSSPDTVCSVKIRKRKSKVENPEKELSRLFAQ